MANMRAYEAKIGHGMLYIVNWTSMRYIEGRCKIACDSLCENPFVKSYLKWKKESNPTVRCQTENRKKWSETTYLHMSMKQTTQRALPISRLIISSISHRFWPPEDSCPFLPVNSQRQNSKESPRTKHRTCPERPTQHPFSRKSKLSQRRQVCKEVKSHFSGWDFENWWIGALVPEGRMDFWMCHISTRQQRGKKASQCQRILQIEHTPIDISTYLWQYLSFISLLIRWKVSLGTYSWRPTFTTEEFERKHQQTG